MPQDQMGMDDSVQASIETVPTDPVFPCASCGKETRRAEPTYEDAPVLMLICTSRVCRTVTPKADIEEVVRITSPADPTGSLDKRPRFPCPAVDVRKDKDGNVVPGVCGKATATHGPIVAAIKNERRICVSPSCRVMVVV